MSKGASDRDNGASDLQRNGQRAETADATGHLLDATSHAYHPVASDDTPLNPQGILDLPDAQNGSDAAFPSGSSISVDPMMRAEREAI
jgi:hypothetical protein